MSEIEELRERLEKAEAALRMTLANTECEECKKKDAACAEMRDVVGENHLWHQENDEYGGYPDSELYNRNINALSASCGSNYIHRDEVRPLVEALEACLEGTNEPLIKSALAHAENLLKGEKE